MVASPLTAFKHVLAGELAKDLTKIPAAKIIAHLHGVLPI
jgi:protein required for attachment to host cells